MQSRDECGLSKHSCLESVEVHLASKNCLSFSCNARKCEIAVQNYLLTVERTLGPEANSYNYSDTPWKSMQIKTYSLMCLVYMQIVNMSSCAFCCINFLFTTYYLCVFLHVNLGVCMVRANAKYSLLSEIYLLLPSAPECISFLFILHRVVKVW